MGIHGLRAANSLAVWQEPFGMSFGGLPELFGGCGEILGPSWEHLWGFVVQDAAKNCQRGYQEVPKMGGDNRGGEG